SSIVLGATLTLLGLLIGFTFSMAAGRYEQRKNYEADEANAIGTEYLRADLLPAANAARARELLVKYLDLRISFYTERSEDRLGQIDKETAHSQTLLWTEAREGAAAQPTPTVALAAAGMNEVLDRQGYTEAAWRNRLPEEAWVLMVAIAVS